MPSEGEATSAGALLRRARESQGLHIAALAASIKVSPRKLDALEGDRYEELASATFTRALAQSVCRALRIDPQPVLALLPPPDAVELDNVTGTLNAPYRERGVREDQGVAATAQRSLMWAGLGLLVAAVVTYFIPGSWLRGGGSDAASAPGAASAPTVVEVVPTPAPATPASAAAAVGGAVATPASAAALAPAAAPAAVPVPPAASAMPSTPSPAAVSSVGAAVEMPVRLNATAASWVEIRDATGRVVFSRILQAGESAGVAGTAPFNVVVGNAAAVQISHRGRPVDLAASTRVNVARLTLE